MPPHGSTAFRLVLASLVLPCAIALAQGRGGSPTNLDDVEKAILTSLQKNPLTSAYNFRTARKDGRILLLGRVGTKESHDIAIQTALAISTSIDDRLIIDSAELSRVAGIAREKTHGVGAVALGRMGPRSSGLPPVYPPLLFSSYEDAFYGFEPPLVTFPPWWESIAPRQIDAATASNIDLNPPVGTDPSGLGANRQNSTIPAGSVEMTLDPRGVALLRGVVPTDQDRVAIGQKVARMEGVTDVLNRLGVQGASTTETISQTDRIPPPPPTPDPDGRLARPPAPPLVLAPDTDNPPLDDSRMADRVRAALKHRPALEGTILDVKVRGGVAYLVGDVPTAFEAMIAFRAAQKTVGIRGVEERLTFQLPEASRPNPLIEQGRPEDVEPYLEAQIRKQFQDEAHIDRVRVVGDRLELKATIPRDEDRARIEAILRSMPLLRGFTVDAKLTPE